MVRRWVRIWVLCGATAAVIGSSAAAEEPAQDKWPKLELSAGTWISVGDTRWAHNASGSQPVLGNPTSKLIYKDVGTNVAELTGKLWFSPKVFAKLNGGIANIGGGRLTDNDYLAVDGGAPSSQTTSDITGTSMYYLNADLGGRVMEFPNHRGYLDVFGGYQYWYQRFQASGLTQVICTTAGQTLNLGGGQVLCNPNTSVNSSVTVITNTTMWHSFRVGASSEYRITRRLSVLGTVAFLPVTILDNHDDHHLRTDLQQNPSFSMMGYGVGADVDAGVRLMLLKNLAASVGYRLYYNRVLSGHLTSHPVASPSQSFPLTEFQSLRHGLTAGLSLIF
jgi:hypothetical protein